jgi:hypothetical protein
VPEETVDAIVVVETVLGSHPETRVVYRSVEMPQATALASNIEGRYDTVVAGIVRATRAHRLARHAESQQVKPLGRRRSVASW